MQAALRVLAALIIAVLLERAAGATAVSEPAAFVAATPSAAPTSRERSSGEPAAATGHAALLRGYVRPERRSGLRSQVRPVSQDGIRGRGERDIAAVLRRALNAPARGAAGLPARRSVRSLAATPFASSGTHVQDASRLAPTARPLAAAATFESRAARPSPQPALAIGQRAPALVTLGGPARLRPSPAWEPPPPYAIRH